MQDDAVSVLIRTKLADGRLPGEAFSQMWGGAGNGETCDICEEVITRVQLGFEALLPTRALMQFHLRCFHLLDAALRGA